MKLDEAKHILNENGYIMEDYNHYLNRFNQMNKKREKERTEIKEDLIKQIIANKSNDYTEKDYDDLFQLNVRQLKKLSISENKYPQMTPEQEEQFKEMMKDFWPFYSGAVDIGKMGLSSNPKAQRRHDKIYSFLEEIYGDDAYDVSSGFDVWLQDIQQDLKKEWLENNPDFTTPIRSNLGVYKLSRATLMAMIDFIDNMDVNKKAIEFIKE